MSLLSYLSIFNLILTYEKILHMHFDILTSISMTHIADLRSKISLIYYIPINVISLDTVDFTECDPMLRNTTLWFSESISPLSETDDVVHNVFLNTQCMRYCDVIHIAP